MARTIGTATSANAMTVDELEAFVRQPREARLATLREDGDVHLTPVWFIYEDGCFRFCLEAARLHLRNLRRHPRATLLVDIDTRPGSGLSGTARGVMARGPVKLSDDDAVVAAFRKRLREHYLSAKEAAAFAADPVGAKLRYTLVELLPDQTLSWDFDKG